LFHGDAVETMNAFPDGSVDLILRRPAV